MNWLTRWIAQKAVRNTLTEVLTMGQLAGYRTYIVGALYVLLNFLDAVGLIPAGFTEMANDIEKVLLGTGLITLRAGMKPGG